MMRIALLIALCKCILHIAETASVMKSSVQPQRMKLSGETIATIEDKLGVNASVPLIELHNFRSPLSRHILAQLLSYNVDMIDTATETQIASCLSLTDESSLSTVALKYADESASVQPDASILYLHRSMLSDDSALLAEITKALSPLLSPPSSSSSSSSSSSKRLFMVIFTGPTASEDLIVRLINEAYSSAASVITRRVDKTSLDVGLITISDAAGSVNTAESTAMKSKLAPLLSHARPARDIEIRTIEQPSQGTTDDVGVSVSLAATSAAYDWVRSTVRGAVLKIQQNERDFPHIVRNLIENADKVFLANIAGANVSPECLRLSRSDLTSSIYELMAPFFRRFMSSIRQDVTAKFNRAVLDDLTVTVHLMRDLRSIRDTFLAEFAARVTALRPSSRTAPSWHGGYELHLFRAQLDEYLNSREVEARLQGVLSRGRRPVSLGIHVLLNHPMGLRDYRQDAIGVRSSDEVVMDASAIDANSVLVKPSIARTLLTADTPADTREFVREMLMFPLSVKNPVVPLVGGRRSRGGGGKRSSMVKKGKERMEFGPERFIRWDLEPMKTARGEIEDKVAAGEKRGMPLIDRMLNVLPYFADGYYADPAIDYGEQYGPSRHGTMGKK